MCTKSFLHWYRLCTVYSKDPYTNMFKSSDTMLNPIAISFHSVWISIYTRAVYKVRGLTLLLRVWTLWRCGDGLFFGVPPLASDGILTTLHPRLKNVLQTVDHFKIPYLLGAPFSWFEKPRNRMGRHLNWILYSAWKKWIGGTPLEHRVQISPHAITGLFQPWKGNSEARNFEMINDLQRVFEKWVERCKKCIPCQGRYFEKETVTAPPRSSDSL
jgi:hypothetical protein